jgi:hypothetical protein
VVANVPVPAGVGYPFGMAASPSKSQVVYAVTGNDHEINAGAQGSALVRVDFATSQAIVHPNIGADPVTVTLARTGTAAYVVDADNPVIDLVDTNTGAVTGTLSLPAPPAPSTSTTSTVG